MRRPGRKRREEKRRPEAAYPLTGGDRARHQSGQERGFYHYCVRAWSDCPCDYLDYANSRGTGPKPERCSQERFILFLLALDRHHAVGDLDLDVLLSKSVALLLSKSLGASGPFVI